MSFPKIDVYDLPDGSFFVHVPLMGEHKKCFDEELEHFFKERQERFSKTKRNDVPLLDVSTGLNKEEIEIIFNKKIRNIGKVGKEGSLK